jgi:hypothetical protein
MAELAQQSEPTGCPIDMSDDRPCGRPIHPAPSDVDEQPVCLMHSHDSNKDQDQFRKEIDAILGGTSAYHRPKNKFDFVQFVFPSADFGGATFTQEADFGETVFGLRQDDAPVASVAIVDFTAARFEQPAKMQFYRVNQGSPRGLRIRLTDSNVENVQFVDVRWHHHGRRMVIQDELDVTASSKPGGEQEQGQREARYELVAIAYRQLISNFEKVRAYDLAEDCSIGAMEMKRRDPAQFLFAQRLGPHYQRWNRLRWLGEQVSVVNLYRSEQHPLRCDKWLRVVP